MMSMKLRFAMVFMFQVGLILGSCYTYEMATKFNWLTAPLVPLYIWISAVNLHMLRADWKFKKANNEVDRHVAILKELEKNPLASYTAIEHHQDQAMCALEIMKHVADPMPFKLYLRKPKPKHEDSDKTSDKEGS
jgi:hypothetical protein